MAFKDTWIAARTAKGFKTPEAAARDIGTQPENVKAWEAGLDVPNKPMLFMIQNNWEMPEATYEQLKEEALQFGKKSAPSVQQKVTEKAPDAAKRPRGRPRSEALKPAASEPEIAPTENVRYSSPLDKAVSEKLLELHQSKAWLAGQMNLKLDQLNAYLEQGIGRAAVAEKMGDILDMKADALMQFKPRHGNTGPAPQHWQEVFKAHSPQAKLILSGKCVFDATEQSLALCEGFKQQVEKASIAPEGQHVAVPEFMKAALSDENALLWNLGIQAMGARHEDQYLDLRGEDLSRKNLQGFDLSNSDLRGAKWPPNHYVRDVKLRGSLLYEGKPHAQNPDFARLPEAVLTAAAPQSKGRT